MCLVLGRLYACFVGLTAKDDLESFVNELLHKSPFGSIIQQAVTASGSCCHLIGRYIHDYLQMVYTPHSSLPDKELEVFRLSVSCCSVSHKYTCICL